jgi:hypothetical protein
VDSFAGGQDFIDIRVGLTSLGTDVYLSFETILILLHICPYFCKLTFLSLDFKNEWHLYP